VSRVRSLFALAGSRWRLVAFSLAHVALLRELAVALPCIQRASGIRSNDLVNGTPASRRQKFAAYLRAEERAWSADTWANSQETAPDRGKMDRCPEKFGSRRQIVGRQPDKRPLWLRVTAHCLPSVPGFVGATAHDPGRIGLFLAHGPRIALISGDGVAVATPSETQAGGDTGRATRPRRGTLGQLLPAAPVRRADPWCVP
jgi:hypothetical protein